LSIKLFTYKVFVLIFVQKEPNPHNTCSSGFKCHWSDFAFNLYNLAVYLETKERWRVEKIIGIY